MTATPQSKGYFYVEIPSEDIKIVFSLDNIRYVDMRPKDEQMSIKGIYIEYIDGKEIYIAPYKPNKEAENTLLKIHSQIVESLTGPIYV